MFERVRTGEDRVREALGRADHAQLIELLDRANAALERAQS
jgi:hypothetical protein